MLSVTRLNGIVFCKNCKISALKASVARLSSSATSESTKAANDQSDYYDIVISGGGMVGTAMAAALGHDNLFRNLKIALIESGKEKKYKVPEIHSNRVCALSNKTVNFFKSIDSFDLIEKTRHGNVHHMHVWDARSDSSISFGANDVENLAIIVENDLIQASLSQNLSKYPNVSVFYASQVKDFDNKEHHVEMKLADERRIFTKLLIGSDGANSFVRQKSGFSTTKWNHEQVAIISTLKLAQKESNQTAWQRFLSTGPIALLPLSDQFSCVIWSIKERFAKELLALSDENFVHRVNEAFIKEDSISDFGKNVENVVQSGLDLVRNLVPNLQYFISDRESAGRLLPPKIEAAYPRASYPLSFVHSNNYVTKRIALIGDAAHKVHPLAGQGVNLGFGDVIRLVECLRSNVRSGSEIGSTQYLENYETERQREIFLKLAGIEFLNRLYTDHDYWVQSPLVAARTAGLTLSNRITPLKSFYIRQAME